MRLLLDTHAFLWWVFDNPRLSRSAREAINNGSNDLLLSTASAWEMAIKGRLGRLDLPAGVPAFVRRQMEANQIQPLLVELPHALLVYDLPDHHKDPFDRLLVAQAMVEGLPIVSADRLLAPYDVTLIW